MRRRTVLVLALIVAVNAALWLAQFGFALPTALGSYFFGPKLVRAEVLLKYGGALHDMRVDRGRIRAVTPTSIKLFERDGSVVDIAVSPTAEVKLGGRLVTLDRLRRGFHATTVREGSDPATTVIATRQ